MQHPTGGVVGELRVRDGDRVKAGDILVRLDETVTRANLAIVTKGLDELYARKARLAANATARTRSTFPSSLLTAAERAGRRSRSWTASASCSNCAARRGSGQKAQLRQRVEQLQEQIAGLTAQQEAKTQGD